MTQTNIPIDMNRFHTSDLPHVAKLLTAFTSGHPLMVEAAIIKVAHAICVERMPSESETPTNLQQFAEMLDESASESIADQNIAAGL